MIKLNRRVVLRAWGAIQNEIGSPVAVEIGAWELWAQVKQRRGSMSSPYQQSVHTYETEITVRYERTRVIGSNMTVDYDNKRFVINSAAFDSEGYREYTVMNVTAVDDSTGTGSGGSIVPLPAIGVYDYVGEGGEQEFTASELAGRYIFNATKDGVDFKILRETGTPGPDKQVRNTKATGDMFWSVTFEPGEQAKVLYI